MPQQHCGRNVFFSHRSWRFSPPSRPPYYYNKILLVDISLPSIAIKTFKGFEVQFQETVSMSYYCRPHALRRNHQNVHS